VIARTVLAVIVTVLLAAALPAPAAAVPSVPGESSADATQPQDDRGPEPDCARNVPVLEQVCDAQDAVAGSVEDAGGAVAGGNIAAAKAAGASVLDQVTKWMTDAARWVTSRIHGLIQETTTPELEAQWYRERFDGMVALGVGLSVLVAMIALGSAALRRDPDALGATFIGMFRAGIGTGIVLALVVLALGVADGITNWVATDASGREASKFWGDVANAWGADNNAGFGSSAIAFVFAVVQVIAGIAVWIELLLRSAGIYVAVLFMPAALAASIWPSLRAWQSRLVSLLFVLIAMKPVIVVVLSLAGSAAAAGGDADKDLGLVIAAAMILVLAAFVPWVLMMLVSMDSEGAWTARVATGSVKGAVASGAGRAGGGLGGALTTAGGGALGARRSGGAGLGGGGRGGGGSGNARGPGDGGPGSGGNGGGRGGGGGSGPKGGGGSGGRPPSAAAPGGRQSPGATSPAPAGAVAAAAGLVPPGGGTRPASGGQGSVARSPSGSGRANVSPATRPNSSAGPSGSTAPGGTPPPRR